MQPHLRSEEAQESICTVVDCRAARRGTFTLLSASRVGASAALRPPPSSSSRRGLAPAHSPKGAVWAEQHATPRGSVALHSPEGGPHPSKVSRSMQAQVRHSAQQTPAARCRGRAAAAWRSAAACCVRRLRRRAGAPHERRGTQHSSAHAHAGKISVASSEALVGTGEQRRRSWRAGPASRRAHSRCLPRGRCVRRRHGTAPRDTQTAAPASASRRSEVPPDPAAACGRGGPWLAGLAGGAWRLI
jgi:hypothetical protein